MSIFPLRRLYAQPCRSFLRKAITGMVILVAAGWNMLAAQAVYDPGNSLFVEKGTVVHVSAADPEPQPPHPARKIRKSGSIARAEAVKKHRNPERPRQNREAQETAHRAATGFTEKKGPEITFRREEARYGILTPGSSGKNGGLPSGAVDLPAAKILSAADVTKHKFLYRESFRHEERSYHSSCRPPPRPADFPPVADGGCTGVHAGLPGGLPKCRPHQEQIRI